MQKLMLKGVSVFLEKRKTRMFVGTLKRKEGKFVFTYNENYFKAKTIIPLGPEFPLTERRFESETLFSSFDDRIPSRENPAFPEYCEAMGIDSNEKDPLVLLSTIGRKGPSSFIFYAQYDHEITVDDLINYRKSLGLTTREFSSIFEISQTSLNAIERGRASGNEVLKRLEIVLCFPKVAKYYFLINGGFLITDTLNNALEVLEKTCTND